MPENRKPFTRVKGMKDNPKGWGPKVADKAKFETRLDDIAERSDVTALHRGDLFYEMHSTDGTYNDWVDDDDDKVANQQWFEVLEVQFMDSDYDNCSANSANCCRCFCYVYPVDEFGNALTKSKIAKIPDYGERWAASIEKNGYAYMREWRGYEDHPISENPILIVHTENLGAYNARGDWKEVGRKVSYDPEPRESKSGNAKRFYKTDDNGNRIIKPEAMDMWKAKHPGEEFDPEFDNFKGVQPYTGYTGEQVYKDLEDKDAYENDLIKFRGNRAERQAFAKRQSQEREKQAAIKAQQKVIKDMYSCFGGYRSEFDKLQKEAGMNEADIEELKKYAKEIGYDYGGGERPTFDMRGLKKWVLDHNGDWEATKVAIHDMSSQFAEARYNAYLANN